ncbi:MAG TPA: bifunctional riboflavin kinase/FAD synthetase [Candidatus Acidoferrales bacterium]|nr:bifunctional riboflavin kinase/FAD synthetase [Candidatus Acidoferrales bacterium]
MPFAIVDSADQWIAHFGDQRKHSAVTIGNFDGVHLGHQQILRRLHDRARRENLTSAVLTFYPHPARLLRPSEAPALLETLEQRLAAIRVLGIETVLVAPFDAALANLSPQEFVAQYLVEAMRAQAVLIGGNFRFGHRQAGDAQLLTDLGRKLGFEVEIVPPLTADGVAVSSTAIRNALREGKVDEARRMLGRPFSLAGEIKPGTGQGRKLVVPTLNLVTEQELLPKAGVYATEAVLEGRTYRAATNIGVRPTFDGAHTTIESHLVGFDQTITAGPLELSFWARLRDERKFSSPGELRQQILRDIEIATRYFEARQDNGLLPRP